MIRVFSSTPVDLTVTESLTIQLVPPLLVFEYLSFHLQGCLYLSYFSLVNTVYHMILVLDDTILGHGDAIYLE